MVAEVGIARHGLLVMSQTSCFCSTPQILRDWLCHAGRSPEHYLIADLNRVYIIHDKTGLSTLFYQRCPLIALANIFATPIISAVLRLVKAP